MEDELHRAFRDMPPAKRGWFCPKDEIIAGYAEGGLAPAARQRAERHLAGCAFCRQQVAALVVLSGQDVPEVSPELFSRAMRLAEDAAPRVAATRWVIAAAAMACLTLAVLPLVRPGAMPVPRPQAPVSTSATPSEALPAEKDSVRTSNAAGALPIVVYPNEGAKLAAQDLEFRWSGTPGGLNYGVAVLSTDGDVKWRQDTQETRLRVPARQLAPGKYYVSVSANLADGKTVRSSPVAFEISGK